MTPRRYRLGFVVCLLLALVSGLFWFVYRSNVQVTKQSVVLMGADGPAGVRLRLFEDLMMKAGLLAVGFSLGAVGFLFGARRSVQVERESGGGAAPPEA